MDFDNETEMRINNAMAAIEIELRTAMRKFTKPFNSAHEGYAVIKEEVDELWEAVKNNKGENPLKSQVKECIQVGAMAARFIVQAGSFIEEKPAELV